MPLLSTSKWRVQLIFFTVFSSTVVLHTADAKPTNLEPQPVPASVFASASVPSAPSVAGDGDKSRRIIQSRTDEGLWQASARLPSSSDSGGNEHSSTKTDLTNGRTIDNDRTTTGRHHRRLHKYEKTSDETSDEGEMENVDGVPLVQSLTAMATHLLDKADDSLENSSEKDVYIHEANTNSNKNNAEEDNESDETASEEDSGQEQGEGQVISPNNAKATTSLVSSGLGIASPWHDGDDDNNDDVDLVQKEKSDTQTPTTPKGLTTWSDINGGGYSSSSSVSTYNKGTIQRLPSDYTVSGALSFSTEKPVSTSQDYIIIKDSEYSTTEVPRTTKSNQLMKKKRPYNMKGKKTPPSKFVKPQLEELSAQAIGSDSTHIKYQLKPVNDLETKTSTNYDYDSYTRKPLWPGQTTRRPIPPKRPSTYAKPTTRPKPPAFLKMTKQPILTLTTPTTSTPSTTTVPNRNPAFFSAFPMSVSLSNMPFMDFLRSQILPRIGLSLISFMATSPIILSLLGAAAGRKKRDVTNFRSSISDREARNEQIIQKIMMPFIDLTALSKKLEDVEKFEEKYKLLLKKPKPTKKFSMFTHLLAKLFKPYSANNEKSRNDKTS